MKKLVPDDLLKFGLIPEFIGRIPIYSVLDPLDVDALVNILTKPKNAILKQYKKLLTIDGVELLFEDEAVKTIAEEALKRKTGARALRSIVEELMTEIMYEIPSREDIKQFIITPEMVKKRKKVIEFLTPESSTTPSDQEEAIA